MDVLADVLSVTRMGATVVAQAKLMPPWGLEVDPIAEAHVHVVQRGTCWLRTSVERHPVRLGAGDCVLIRGTDLEARLADDRFVASGVVRAEILEVSPAKTAPHLAFLLDGVEGVSR